MKKIALSIIAILAFFVAISEPTFTSWPWPNAIAVVVLYIVLCALFPSRFIEKTK